jgi:FlaA1/EpsC-like NDP-sugar epimerase
MQLVSALKSHPEIAPIGFVDDNAALKNQIVAGLPVFSGAQVEQVIEDTRPARVVVAMPSVERKVIARVERRLRATGVDVRLR